MARGPSPSRSAVHCKRRSPSRAARVHAGHSTAKGAPRIDDDAPRRIRATKQWEETHRAAALIVLDASQRAHEDGLHAKPTFAARVDDFAEPLDEEVDAVRLELLARERVLDVEGIVP
jgi:hypothetical protein